MIVSETALRETAARAPTTEPADQSHGSGAKADNQRVTTTVEHARQNVATLIVGTEDKSVAGSLASRKDLDRAIGGKKGARIAVRATSTNTTAAILEDSVIFFQPPSLSPLEAAFSSCSVCFSRIFTIIYTVLMRGLMSR